MNDLTEKREKGELPVDKDYYIKLKSGLILIDYYCQLYDNCHFPNGIGFDSIPENDIAEVLAPVPSYEEWKKAYECVVSENEEIATLKELLKECRDEINPYIEVVGGKKTFKNLIDKINEVLK